MDSFKTPIDIAALAHNYRQLVLWVGFQSLLSIGLPLFGSLSKILAPGLIATTGALAFYAYRTAKALGESSPSSWAAAMLLPCINLITLLSLSSKATTVCRAHGVSVGLFGPRV